MIRMTLDRYKVTDFIIKALEDFDKPEREDFNPMTTLGYIGSFLAVENFVGKVWDTRFYPRDEWIRRIDDILDNEDPALNKSGIKKEQKEMARQLSLKQKDIVENYAYVVHNLTGADENDVIGALFDLLDQAEKAGVDVLSIKEKDVKLPTYLLNTEDEHDITM